MVVRGEGNTVPPTVSKGERHVIRGLVALVAVAVAGVFALPGAAQAALEKQTWVSGVGANADPAQFHLARRDAID